MSIKQKIKNFWKNHKEEIIAGGVILGCVGVAAVCDFKRHKQKDALVEESFSPIMISTTDENKTVEEVPQWDASYTKNWNTMVELAQRIKLAPGESYIIDEGGLSKMSSGIPINGEKNCLAHYIDGYECYPDEDWWERYLNGDTALTGDNYESRTTRLVYAINGIDLNPGECFHYGYDSDTNEFVIGMSKNNSAISMLKKAYTSERFKDLDEEELHNALFDYLAKNGFDVTRF